MSNLFVNSSIDDFGFSPAEFRVLFHLSRRDSPDRGAFASVPTMARVCKLNEKTVRSALKRLLASRCITSDERPGRTTIYRVVNDFTRWLPLPKETTGSKRHHQNKPPVSNGAQPYRNSTPPPSQSERDEGDPTRKSIKGDPITKSSTTTAKIDPLIEDTPAESAVTQLAECLCIPFDICLEEAKLIVDEWYEYTAQNKFQKKNRQTGEMEPFPIDAKRALIAWVEGSARYERKVEIHR